MKCPCCEEEVVFTPTKPQPDDCENFDCPNCDSCVYIEDEEIIEAYPDVEEDYDYEEED